MSPGVFEGHFWPLCIDSKNRSIQIAITINKTTLKHQIKQKSLKLSHIQTSIKTYLEKYKIFLAKNRSKFPQLFQVIMLEIAVLNINDAMHAGKGFLPPLGILGITNIFPVPRTPPEDIEERSAKTQSESKC